MCWSRHRTKRLLGREGISEIPESHAGSIDAESEDWRGDITGLKTMQLLGSKVHNRAFMVGTLATSGQGAKPEPSGKVDILWN